MKESRKRIDTLLARANRNGGSGGSSGSTGNHQQWGAVNATVVAGASADVTDTSPTLSPKVSGVFLVTGMISGSIGAGGDNGSFAFVQHSLDGGVTWLPVTIPAAGDQRCPLASLPPAGGVAGSTTVVASFAFIISLPSTVGSANGVKFKIVASASGGQLVTTAGRGAITAVELAA